MRDIHSLSHRGGRERAGEPIIFEVLDGRGKFRYAFYTLWEILLRRRLRARSVPLDSAGTSFRDRD